MAAAILRVPPLFLQPAVHLPIKSRQPQKPSILALKPISINPARTRASRIAFRSPGQARFLRYAANGGEAIETEDAAETEIQESAAVEEQVEDGASESSVIDVEERPASVVMESLQLYKEAVANGDEAKVTELEAFFISLEDEKKSLESKVAALSLELSSERERILRISADFDNFRKRTERERLSLVNNVQGEVIESLLPVLDNFERAKAQIKIETEGEEKINNSYQSIYKQFTEILSSLGVTAIETVGNQFDPLLHEAIMQGESTEFEEGIILQEFRRGFSIGERLLRPSMVKVSSGPGPQKPEETSPPGDSENGSNEAGEGGNGRGEEEGSTTERSDA